MRSQAEITSRFDALVRGDIMGFKAEMLIGQLDFEHAKPYLKEGATEAEWDRGPISDDEVRKDAVGYLDFAYGKALDHRGISASRSVDKMEEYLWLLGLDVDRFNAAGYQNYGVPQLFVAAELLGVAVPDDEALARMAQGLPCAPGCREGCEQ